MSGGMKDSLLLDTENQLKGVIEINPKRESFYFFLQSIQDKLIGRC